MIAIKYFLLLLPVCVQANPLIEASATNGRQWVSQQCVSCHIKKFGGDGSSIYTRTDRKVRDLGALQQRVHRCSQNLNVGWTTQQEMDAVIYLNQQYYHFSN